MSIRPSTFVRPVLASAFVALFATASMGCQKLQVTYTPSSAAAAPASGADLAVKVVDARPEEHGGKEKKIVGQTRGSYGIPQSLDDEAEDVAPRTVSDMTKDAMRRAGVASKGNGKTLQATIKEYWLDGMVGYKGTVVIEYAVLDASGQSLWSKTLTGSDGGQTMTKSRFTMTQDIYQKALSNLSEEAVKEFQSPEFLAAAK